MELIELIRNQLVKIIEDIDAGNSNLTEDEALAAMKCLKRYSRRDEVISKVESCEYLGISRSKFDSLVRDGLIPNGTKHKGFKELSWTRRDLDKYVKKYKI